MSQEKRFKKGDLIFKEGDVLSSFYLLQSGRVSLFLERAGQRTEIDQPAIGQMFGEQGIFGFPKQMFSAEAQTEVRVVEMPIDPMKTVFEKSPGAYKLFVKAMGDELRRLRGIVKSNKMDGGDTGICPPRMIPRLCAILVLVAEHSGQKPKPPPTNVAPFKKPEEPQGWVAAPDPQSPGGESSSTARFRDTDIIVNFNTLKIYTARMFLESPQRMQGFCEILCKLGYVSLRYEKNEDTEMMELQEVRIHDKDVIEHFGEFYQHNFFRAGKSEMIVVEKTAVLLAMGFSELAAPLEIDRNGAVRVLYKDMTDHLRTRYAIDFKDTHVNLLEKKGLFMKRQTVGEDVFVSYDRHEWTQTSRFWRIIQEIDRWNQTGAVNMNEDLTAVKSLASGEKCPSCGHAISSPAKFCPECGNKLAA